MIDSLADMFDDVKFHEEVRAKLPYLFRLAELELSRAGKTGMEVGTLREHIIIALLIHKFGKDKVETKIPITEYAVDVKLFGKPLSIKTVTGSGGVKAIWTVNAKKAREFIETYEPKCDIILAHVKWGGFGGLYYIPVEAQREVFSSMGKERYLKPPKPGTNPRGVEFSKEALQKLMVHSKTKSVRIDWLRPDVEFDPYERWVKYWKKRVPSNIGRQLHLG
ncbi:MAG: ThaI family type II restriction endonuclease [Candidatus Bathyarchaeia archaeon]|nr:ThaI family type II restriction endonuclease [Candidatus Bathyarchaeia archaeon]